MEAGSLDDDYDDYDNECVDFMDLVVFWGRKLGGLWRPVTRD